METPLQRVERLLDETGKTWADLARLLRYSEQRLTNWKARGAIPRAETQEIAKALGVSIDYIVTGQCASADLSAPTLTHDEQALVALYRGLTHRQKGEAINNLEAQKQANDAILQELTRQRA